MNVIDTVSQSGNPCLRVEFKTPYRNFTIWLQKEAKNERALRDYKYFLTMQEIGIKTVTYNKEQTGFFKILNYNEEVQKI